MRNLPFKKTPKWIIFISEVVFAILAIAFFVTALPVLLFFIFSLSLFCFVMLRTLRNEVDLSQRSKESDPGEVIDIEPDKD